MPNIVFEFIIDDTQIVATGNDLTGKEQIYVSGDLVSEKRSFKKTSSHEIEINGENYIIKFDVESFLKGNIYCSIIKNDIIHRKFIASYKNQCKFELKNKSSVITILVGFIIGILGSPSDLSFYGAIILCIIIFIVASAIEHEQKLIIKEMDI